MYYHGQAETEAGQALGLHDDEAVHQLPHLDAYSPVASSPPASVASFETSGGSLSGLSVALFGGNVRCQI